MSVLSDSQMIVGDGSGDPVAESGATLRTSIGVGTGDSPTFTGVTAAQVDITGEGDLRLQDNTGGQYVGFDAPTTVSSSYTLTMPAAIGSVNQVLSINNTDGTLQWATPEAGDITSVVAGAGMTGGATSGAATLNVIGTTDKITVSSDAITIASGYVGQTSITTLGTIATGTWQGTTVAVNQGGTGLASYTTGDLPYASGSTAISKLAIGSANKVLTSSGSAPQWSTQIVNAALPTNIDVGGTLDVTGVTTLDSTLGVASDVAVATSVLFVDASENAIGVGTATPNYLSSVAAITLQGSTQPRIEIVGTRTSDDTVGVLTFINQVSGPTNNQLCYIAGNRSGADDSGSLSFHTFNAGSNVTAMTIVPAGLVGIPGTLGIGTEGQANKLYVNESTANTQVAWFAFNATDAIASAVGVNLRNTDLTANSIGGLHFYMADNGGNTSDAAAIITGKDQLWTTTASTRDSYLAFGTATDGTITEKVRIESDGNVGIGTTSPDCPLRINFNDSRMITLDRLNAGTGDIAIHFKGGTDASATAGSGYGVFSCNKTDVSDGAEDASFTWDLKSSGSSTERMVLDNAGNLTADGTKSFRIDHPVASMTDTHKLIYYAAEGPRADLLFRGVVDLVSGTAAVDLDAVSLQTDGTFAALTRDPQIWVQNTTGWDAVRGTLSGNVLTITCQEATSTDTIHWLVVADRYDTHMQEHMTTDATTGRPLVEYEKPGEEAP